MKGIKFKKHNEDYYSRPLYEVGDLYITTKSENPSVRFGGTWELYGPGRTLVCVDTSQTEFNTVRKMGGNKNLQNHSHSLGNADIMVWTNSWGVQGNQGTVDGTEMMGSTGIKNNYGKNIPTGATGTGNSGNLQPFITCYVWIRTA